MAAPGGAPAGLRIGYVTVVVPSYDEAIAYYTGVLGFQLLEDTALAGGKRWVLVAPSGPDGCALLLAQPRTAAQAKVIGRQAGGRVFLFLHTDDFRRDHDAFRARGVAFCEEPRHESYGTVAKFEDRFGNLWDLLELKPRPDAHGRV